MLEKSYFYEATTTREAKRRVRSNNNTAASKRSYSFKYFIFGIDTDKERICKAFYLSTLDVSQIRISYFHASKKESCFPRANVHGKHVKERKTVFKMKEGIRSHINSIPRISSHY